MFDFGILALPFLGFMSVFTVSLFLGDEVTIDKIEVPIQLEWRGYDSVVATRQLSDELREIDEIADSEIQNVDIDQTDFEVGVEAFEDYFGVTELINGARSIFGLTPFYVNGELTEDSGEVTLVLRLFGSQDPNAPDTVKVVTVKGSLDDLHTLFHDAALQILEGINPYTAALYLRRIETAAKEYDFPKTREAVDRFLRERPVDEHFLIYSLQGRMLMIRAEEDTTLTPAQREAEYTAAMKQFEAALHQDPDFLYPLINLGQIHAMRRHYDLAERYFARAVEVEPNRLETRQDWGDMLIEQGRVRDAIIQYSAAVEIEPSDDKLRDTLATLYVRAGQPDAARRQWEEAFLISPTNSTYATKIESLGGRLASP